jgi:hypothetical protein
MDTTFCLSRRVGQGFFHSHPELPEPSTAPHHTRALPHTQASTTTRCSTPQLQCPPAVEACLFMCSGERPAPRQSVSQCGGRYLPVVLSAGVVVVLLCVFVSVGI